MTNEQEQFWAGEFGDAYIERNRGEDLIASNVAIFSRALESATDIGSVLEFGSNIGENLRALRTLLPNAKLSAVEVNAKAAGLLKARMPDVDVYTGSALGYRPAEPSDLVLTKGVLIHIAPENLPTMYARMVECASRYLLVAEYYSQSPEALSYRGHAGKLFKRDYAGELLDAYPSLTLRDYGFIYHRDPLHPPEDLNWFLLEKRG